MKIHIETGASIYTGGRDGGCQDIAHIQFIGMTLVDNGDLARLRQIAACMDADPIPANIVDVLELCLHAIGSVKTLRAMRAKEAIRDLLKAAGAEKGTS